MQRIGRYQVLDQLGQGAMGIVYRCLDPNIGREIALKTIRMADAADTDLRARQRERLFREARSAGVLNHPAIVTVYDIAEEGGQAFIAMELVRGKSLETLLAGGGTLPGNDLLRLLREAADGLDYAHRQGVIHRDIKPANVMVNLAGHVKITDFGIAKITDLEQMTVSGMIVGTPNYMSPEQVQGKPVTGQADQYSLAVIAYEMVTGERPFVADQLPTLVYKIVCEEPVSPQRLNPSLGPQIDAVLRRGLAKIPDDRYQSCSAFVDELEKACRATPGWKGLPRGGSHVLPTQSDTAPAPAAVPATAPPLPVEAQPPQPSIALPPPPPKLYLPEERRSRVSLFVIVLLAAAGSGGYWAWENYGSPFAPAPELPVAVETARPGQAPSPPTQTTGEPAPAPADSTAPAELAVSTEPPAPATPETVQTESTPTAPVSTHPVEPDKPKNESPPPPTPKPVRKAPAPEPAPATVWRDVKVRSEPSGARVMLDGLAGTACRTPCSFKADRGNHVVTASLAGHREARRSFYVSDEPVDLLITLTPTSPAPATEPPLAPARTGQATVFLQSNPSGATVTVNGKPWPKPTPAQLVLPAGTHQIVLEKGGSRATQTLTVRAGDFKQISITLAP